EQILDVTRTDLLALPQQRDELVLNRLQRDRVEEERLLDAHELARLEEQLEELVLLIPAEAGACERFLRTRRRGRRLAKLALEPVDRRLLNGRQAQLVRGQADLVTIDGDAALRVESAEDVGEHPLVGVRRAHAELFARHPRAQRLRAVELLEGGGDQP